MSQLVTDPSAASVNEVDFRRPSRVGRDAIVALEATHDVFARRLAGIWSSQSYAAVEIEHVATDQLSLDDFVRSLPLPTALGLVQVAALEATAFVQLDLPFALLAVERLLGGAGDPAVGPIDRRPTELEVALLRDDLLAPAVAAIDEALKDLAPDGATSQMSGFETNPQPLQLGSPGELLLLLTFHVELRDELPAQGLVTVAYPVAELVPKLEEMLTGGRGDADQHDLNRMPLTARVLDAEMDVRVRIGGTTMGTRALASLQPGDVLRLDHPVDRPADLVIDDTPLGTAHLGKRRRKVAVQVVTPPTPASAHAPATADPAAAAAPADPKDPR